MQVAKSLIAKLDWGMTAQEAIAAPNIYFTGTSLLLEPNTPLAGLQIPLASLGRTVLVTDFGGGKANAAEWTPDGWRGAYDPRSEGVALEQ